MTTETEENATRTIGPVTTATGAGAAAAYLICAIAEMAFSVTLTTEFQGALTVVLVVVSGWIVPATPRKRGRHV